MAPDIDERSIMYLQFSEIRAIAETLGSTNRLSVLWAAAILENEADRMIESAISSMESSQE